MSVLGRCGITEQGWKQRRGLHLHDSGAPRQKKAQLAIWEWVQ